MPSEDQSAGTTRKRRFASIGAILLAGFTGLLIVGQVTVGSSWSRFAAAMVVLLIGLLAALEILHGRVINVC